MARWEGEGRGGEKNSDEVRVRQRDEEPGDVRERGPGGIGKLRNKGKQ